MIENSKRYGCCNKRRFSLKYTNGVIERFGSCDPKDDDNATIVEDSVFFLSRARLDGLSTMTSLDPNTEWTNGYYDKEHDGWKPLSEWIP